MEMDPILYWNAVALEANRVSHDHTRPREEREQNGPTLSSRALAIVHLAMYEAFARVSGGLPLYFPQPDLPAPGANASPDAAVAAAAHATLSSLFPSQKAFFDSRHAQASLSGATLKEGHEFGLKVAAKMLDERKGDPGAGDDGYAASMAYGAHRPDPDNAQGYHAPFYGARSRCFAVTARHDLLKPPLPGDAAYTKALQQVRGKGIAPELMGTLPQAGARRSASESVIGVYWGYDGASGLGTPPRLYNQILRRIARDKDNTPSENARLFALANVAMGDAGILAWEQKYIHDLWRPVVGIREHDGSMGPAGAGAGAFSADCDPYWLPLGAPNTNVTGAKNGTPPFPAYPSGHATFGAAVFHITRLFYGPAGVNKGGVSAGDTGPDNLFDGLTFVSDELNGVNKDNKGTVRPRHVREFEDGLWQMILENGRSRVYLGVHWIFDAFMEKNNGDPDLNQNIGGVPLGLKIAEDIFATGMKRSSVGPS